MAPQKPRSRPTSGPPSPVKTPRHSTDRRTSRSPKKRTSISPEKRQSLADKRASYTSDRDEKRKSNSSSFHKGKGAAVTVQSGPASSTALSADSLAKLDAQNDRETRVRRSKDKVATGRIEKPHKARKEKVVLEKTRPKRSITASLSEKFGNRGGFLPQDRKKRRILCLAIGFIILLIAILVPVGVLVIGKQNNGGSSSTNSNGGPNNGNLNGVTVPPWAQGTYFDPFTWYDTEDFNVTVTNTTVGNLPIMGLNSTWDDSTQANPNVPPLNKKFAYGTMPIRGINVGGWLALEPFITPSFFNEFGASRGVVDEYTLTQTLGPTQAAAQLEKHYSSFINAQSFADIRNAGFDHVRIPYSYWAVTTYSGDPYVPKIAWRYLLRGIEYARQNGLRVNLDLHAVPGSQNGWNHSGRQGLIGWLNGTDGDLNAQRSLDIHNQLSQFFAQPRYKNVVGIYGLVNEPKMISLPIVSVLNWTQHAIDIVRGNGINQTIVFGDGFLGIPNWQGKLQGIENIVLDAHQYTIFNTGQIQMDHQAKLSFACAGWAGQMDLSTNPATGYVFCFVLFATSLTNPSVSDQLFAANGPKQTRTVPPT